MDLKKINKQNAEYFKWGNICDGWHLVRTPDISVIEERMPPNTAEVRHYHNKAWQFIYVLYGELNLEIDGTLHLLKAQDGFAMPPVLPHVFTNTSKADTAYLLVTIPNNMSDRINIG